MIALEPLSRELNKLSKILINNTSINHKLYMDDIKIFAHTPENVLEIKKNRKDTQENLFHNKQSKIWNSPT